MASVLVRGGPDWEIEVLHGWTRVKKRGPSCEMPSVARRLVVRQSWHGAWYKRVYMWFLIIRGSRDVWIWWSQPTLPLSVWCAPQDCLSSSFCVWFLYLDTEWFAVDIVLVCCWWLVKGVARPPMLCVAENHRLQAHRHCCLTWIFCVKWNMRDVLIFQIPIPVSRPGFNKINVFVVPSSRLHLRGLQKTGIEALQTLAPVKKFTERFKRPFWNHPHGNDRDTVRHWRMLRWAQKRRYLARRFDAQRHHQLPNWPTDDDAERWNVLPNI